MTKRPPVAPSTLAYMERKLAHVEAQRAHPASAADLARLLAELQSPDERVRARAVRQVCPCRLPWEVFRRVRKAAQRLRHDPSALVRANARHVEEDAREIEALEALRERVAERAEREVDRKRARGRGRRSTAIDGGPPGSPEPYVVSWMVQDLQERLAAAQGGLPNDLDGQLEQRAQARSEGSRSAWGWEQEPAE
jgi:hypothetical protein